MENLKGRPPKPAEKLLSFLLPDEDRYFMLGNYEELFHDIMESKGKFIAFLWYWLQVLIVLPISIMDSIKWGNTMFSNYFKLSARILAKNKVFSVINILGLAFAISCCILVFSFVYSTFNLSKIHKNSSSIYLLESKITSDNVPIWSGETPSPLHQNLKNSHPEILRTSQALIDYGFVKTNENEQSIFFAMFVDNSFFGMFNFPFEYRNDSKFTSPNEVFITQTMANKIFGSENPINKLVTLKVHEVIKDFKVAGILSDLPYNSAFRFEILLPIDSRIFFGYNDLQSWQSDWTYNFIQTKTSSNDAVLNKIARNLPINNILSDESKKISAYQFKNIEYLYSQNPDMYFNPIDAKKSGVQIYIFIGIGFIILSIACFNYVNISISTSSKRFVEIGMRKVLGGTKKELIKQFLSESLLSTTIAFILSFAIIYAYLLDELSLILGRKIDLQLSGNYEVWFYLIGIILLTAISAGLYPAIYVARFQPDAILRGNAAIHKKKNLTKILLGLQFSVSFITLVLSMVIISNFNYLKNIDQGFVGKDLVVYRLGKPERFQILNSEISKHLDVESTAGTAHHILGNMTNNAKIDINGGVFAARLFPIGENYLRTIGAKILSGKDFEAGGNYAKSTSVIVSESFLKSAGLKNVLGQTFNFEEKTLTITGVVKDIAHATLKSKVVPVVFSVAKPEEYDYLIVRAKPGKGKIVANRLQELVSQLIPDSYYKVQLQENIFYSSLEKGKEISEVFIYIGIVAMLIFTMGLFAVASVNITSKIKEIGIRKILGAKVMQIFTSLIKEFIELIIISAIIASPVVYFILQKIYSDVTYHEPILIWPFFVSFLFILFVALFSIIWLVLKAGRINPVDTIKIER